MDINIVRSNRKSICIQVNPDLTVTVRAPLLMPRWEIDRFIKAKELWLEKTLKKVAESNEANKNANVTYYTEAELKALAKSAKKYIPTRAAYFAPMVGVSYNRIAIKCQHTKWGSCSSKGNLNFNCLLMLMSPEIIDYVVVHELCHRKVMNHSAAFWSEVERVMPDYKVRRSALKRDGRAVMQRLY
ncbi:MAG: SprT family zinc-dependent metalloprotease [Eubacteriales bacterium]|nr:SprT family zinc-dependent metalloprotease [Eubacteriales bacterium]